MYYVKEAALRKVASYIPQMVKICDKANREEMHVRPLTPDRMYIHVDPPAKCILVYKTFKEMKAVKIQMSYAYSFDICGAGASMVQRVYSHVFTGQDAVAFCIAEKEDRPEPKHAG